jgi:hypothetical protein
MKVATIVKLKRECLNNPAGTLGVVFNDYGDGSQVIFPNGMYDGFNETEKCRWLGYQGEVTEKEFFLEEVGFEPSLAGYQFLNVMRVDQDFHRGIFDAVLKK